MNAHISAVLQPFNEHFETILSKAITRKSGFGVGVAEKAGTVVLLDTAPAEILR
jgi:hypothetical protein